MSLGLPPVIWMGITAFALTALFRFVNLEPQVEPNFFFSETDPAFQADLRIQKMFPEPDQVIVSIDGPVKSQAYIDRLSDLTLNLLALHPIFSAQSLVMGPVSPEKAWTSPLWRRVLLSQDGESSLIILFTNPIENKEVFWQLEEIAHYYETPDFDVMISGAAYVIELIRRHLVKDLKTFTLSALIIFTLVVSLVFRSLRILAGTVVTCVATSVSTLFCTHWFNIPVGPLTANLSTIVIVLTLSHIAYMTFNWKHLLLTPDITGAKKERPSGNVALQALKMTIRPSFWSMFTTFLGFLSLSFVEAAPLRMLGISGCMGTFIAFVITYLVYPWFLRWKTPVLKPIRKANRFESRIDRFLEKGHPGITTFIFVGVVVSAIGLWKIDNDPSLLSYFKSGTSLREGLDYVDAKFGSSPLKIVLMDREGRKFNEKSTNENFWKLQQALENDPAVGNIISLPMILSEAKSRVPFAFLFKLETFLKYLDRPEYGKIASQFVTRDRMRSLLAIRMRTLFRDDPRQVVIDRIQSIILDHGFRVEMMGGIYLLQGKLAGLVVSSLITGLGLLFILFIPIGILLSRSIYVTFMMLVSLATIPVWILGLVGHFRVPLDIISSPATNLAIAMGVDAVIHLLNMVRHCHAEEFTGWEAWAEARTRLWKPILSSASIVCAGFAIFGLSEFPPTQRFGLEVVGGTLMAALAAIFVLPTLASTGFHIRLSHRESSGEHRRISQDHIRN